MRSWMLAVSVVVTGCSDDSLSQRLRDACEAHECPSDPPRYISCMPIVAPEWEPVCSTSCRAFLQQTCKISFVD